MVPHLPPKKRYRIKQGVRPYPGRLLIVDGENSGSAWGHVRISDRRYSDQKTYYKSELDDVDPDS
jgi:hypothetical protein